MVAADRAPVGLRESERNVFEVLGRLELNDDLLPSWLPGFLRDSFFSEAGWKRDGDSVDPRWY